MGIKQEALTLIPPPPCDYGCPHVERCAGRHLACQAFKWYVEFGGSRLPNPGSREPSKMWFVDVYRGAQ